jgi:1,2-diacylglycerol 3-alpha-glucosyltransferase
MKIGLFADTYWPQVNGVATSVLMLKEQMEQRGHEVHVVTTTDPLAPKTAHNVHRVRSVPFVSKRRAGSFYNPRLRKKIDALDLDIIHTHTEFTLGRFGRAIARQNNIAFVHTMHTIYEDYTHFIIKSGRFDRPLKVVARKLCHGFCNSADQVIVPTSKVKDKLLGYDVRRPMEVIPTGIDLGKFQQSYSPEQLNSLRSRYGIAPDDILLSYIGRVSIEKNIGELLHGLQPYLPAHPHVKVMIVGDGPARKGLQELTAYLEIQKQVVFTGEIPWDDIAVYYQIGDLFINASQSEAQGLTYIEALASGLPLLVRDDPCVADVVQNGVNGYTYEKQQQFLDRLDELVCDPERLRQLAEAGLASSARFSAEGFAASVLRLYTMLLQRGR